MRIEVQLSNFIDEISMGPFGSDIKVENFVDDGVPVLNGANLLGYKLNDNSFNYVTLEKAKTFRKAIAKRGDIIITHRGTLGQICYVPENSKFEQYVISQSQFRVKFNEDKIDPRYIVYLFHTPYGQKKLLSFKSHVGVPALAQATTNFRALNILVHKLEDQKKIANVITAIEDKIELNNRINAELEQMAKTIFDYWFVQFDFPISAKYAASFGQPELEDKPYKSSGGKMVWSEELKRDVPEGWDVVELSDIANITMGQSPPGSSYNEESEGTVFFQGCTDFGNRFPTIRKFTTEPTRFAKIGDILLSVRAPVGTMNIANNNCCIGRGLAALNSRDNCISYLFGVMVNLKQVFDRRNTDGTTFGSITKDDLYSLKVVRPTKPILESYNQLMNPSFLLQNELEGENQKLTELRDWLLPMLMNGQVRVGDVEQTELLIAAEPQMKYGK